MIDRRRNVNEVVNMNIKEDIKEDVNLCINEEEEDVNLCIKKDTLVSKLRGLNTGVKFEIEKKHNFFLPKKLNFTLYL